MTYLLKAGMQTYFQNPVCYATVRMELWLSTTQAASTQADVGSVWYSGLEKGTLGCAYTCKRGVALRENYHIPMARALINLYMIVSLDLIFS